MPHLICGEDQQGDSMVCESNGNTANYINNLIQVNENLLNCRPPILSKFSSSGSGDSTASQTAIMKNLCSSQADIIRLFQSIQTTGNASSESIKIERGDMDFEDQDHGGGDHLSKSPKLSSHRQIAKSDSVDSAIDVKPVRFSTLSPGSISKNESFSSVDDDEGKGAELSDNNTDEESGGGGGVAGESRRNSLRLKYSQMSISRKTRRSSKSLNRMLQKTGKVEELSEPVALQSIIGSSRSTYSCQRCSKTFVNRSLLSRHWGAATKCYICSVSMCDLKDLNEHMKSAHSEYTSQ
eukprot:sb/3467505/